MTVLLLVHPVGKWQGVRGGLHWRTWAVWQMSRRGVQGCVWFGHCTDPSVPRISCSGWRSEAAQEQLLCCSCAVSAKRGDAGEVEREVHGCWSTAEEQRLALGRGIWAGFCPSHHLLGIVAWLGSSAQDLEIRNVQSALMTPQCVLPLLAGAGNGTEDTVAWCGPPVFLTSRGLSARGLSGDIQSSDARALHHLQCSPFGCHSITTSPWQREWFSLGKWRFISKSPLL